LVFASLRKEQAVYECEICGFGYRDLRTAEACEEFCDTHGFSSQEILKKAIHHPAINVMPLAVQ